MKLSREYRLYIALWRKAFRQIPEELIVDLKSENMAISVRQGLYRAIKPFRDGKQLDSELVEAVERLVVYLDKDNGRLIFRERKSLATLEDMMEELGIVEDDLKLEAEKALEQELEDLIEQPIKPRATPFYER